MNGHFVDAERPPVRLSPSVLGALRTQLRTDDWRSNPDWSLIHDTQTPATMRQQKNRDRWMYSKPLLQEILDRLDQNHVSHDYLLELTREDGLVGWNAAILLAQRTPLIATVCSDRLQEIVSQPLRYDPKTGRRTSEDLSETRRDETPKSKTGPKAPDKVPLQRRSNQELLELAGGAVAPKTPTAGPSLWDDLTKQMRRTFGQNKPVTVPGVAISRSLQSAAAESWCRALAADFGDPEQNLAPAGRLLNRVKLPMHIREELIRGVARYIKPARIPQIDLAFPETGDDANAPRRLRQAALEACLIYARAQRLRAHHLSADERRRASETAWPRGLKDRVYDPEPELRILFGRWAALADQADTRSVLTEQQRDIHPSVRQAALVSIGVWGGEEARSLLREAAKSESALIRAAAATGLTRWGPVESARFLSDSSDTVRVAVVKALADSPHADTAVLFDQLMRTSSSTVQRECVWAVKNWPEDLAIPVLLQGMSDGRGDAIAQSWHALRERKKLADHFPVHENESARQHAVQQLVARYTLPMNRPKRSLVDVIALPDSKHHQLRTTMAADLKVLVDSPASSLSYRQAVDRLEHLDRRALPDLETLIATSWRHYPDDLAEKILPKLNPVYSDLWKLSLRDPLVRQRAAANLAAYAEKSSLSPLMVNMLEERITARPDRDVWRNALQAIMHESRPEHRWLVIRASQFPVPEIRRMACDYFAKNPQPDFADRVVELMNDRDDRTVQLAAVRAAGSYHHPFILNGNSVRPKKTVPTAGSVEANPPRLGLLALLRSSDREISEAAAVSLARLGHESGYRELQRMSFDSDGRKRADVFRRMGVTGARRFIEHLILRGQKEESYAARRAILAALDELTAPEERPLGLSNVSGYDIRIEMWNAWLQRRGKRTTESRPLRSVTADSELRRQR